jgi:hypothetical protein
VEAGGGGGQRRGEEGRGGGHRHARARGLRLVFLGGGGAEMVV